VIKLLINLFNYVLFNNKDINGNHVIQKILTIIA